MRKYIIFIAALWLLAGSATATIATYQQQTYDLRGYVDATRTTDLPYRIPRLGVNADLLQYDLPMLQQHFAWMNDANIRWIRQFIDWSVIEPQRGQFKWSVLDDMMAELHQFPQMQLVPVFVNTPEWARSSDVVTAPPDDPNTMIPFLQAFTARYSDQITYYQVWDEPNLDDAWGLQAPRPADYAALLAGAYGAIHSRDDNAVVILAALAPTTETSGQNIAEHLYLQQLYDLGAGDFFDAVAGKPYGFDSAPDNRDVRPDTLNFSRLILLREVMVANGDGDKALWASHFGWNSLPDDWMGSLSIWGATSTEERLDYTINAIERADREWPWLGGMILHHWQPNVEPDDPQWGFSVVDQTYTLTPLYDVLANMPEMEAARDGLYHPRTRFAAYSGLWTFSELGADIGWLETSDSQLSFTFTGTDVALRLREGDYFAFLYPTVDGEIPNAPPHDANGNAYVLLRSGSRQPEVNMVPIARSLPYNVHQLDVVADRGRDQWALAGYAVSSGDLTAPYRAQLSVSWLTLVMSGIAVVVSGFFLPWSALLRANRSVFHLLDGVWQMVITVATSLALMLGLLLSVGLPDQPLLRRDMAEQVILVIVTGGLLVIELPLLMALVALLVLFWLIYHHIEWGLLLVILYAPFFLFPVELYLFFFPMSELLLLITFAAWLLRVFVQWGIERQTANSDFPLHWTVRWHPLDILMLIWCLLGCIAVLWSTNHGTALTELRTLFIEPTLFYLISRSVKPDKAMIRQFVLALLISAGLVSVIGLYLYLTGQGIITAEGGARRLVSVYGSPNNVGLLLGRALPFAVAAAMLLRGRWQVMSIGLAGLFMITVGLTQSIGAILIGIPTGIAAVLIVVYKRRALLPLLVLGVVGVIITLALTQVSARFASLLDLSTGTTFIRIRVWESALEILSRYPLTGLGLDQFLPVFSAAYVRPDAIADPNLSHPHNMLLDFWIRLGVMGALWLITFIVIFWRTAWHAAHQVQTNGERWLFAGTIGAMAALIGHGMIDNSVYVNDLVYIFMMLIGIMVQCHHGLNRSEMPSR